MRSGMTFLKAQLIVAEALELNCTPDKPYKVIFFLRNERYRASTEEQIKNYKDCITKINPSILEAINFEIFIPEQQSGARAELKIDDWLEWLPQYEGEWKEAERERTECAQIYAIRHQD